MNAPLESTEHIAAALQRTLGERYRLGGQLGSGSIGTVWRAAPTDSGGDVAIKVLHPRLGGDRSAREQLVLEAELGRRIEAVHVVPIIEYGELGPDANQLPFVVSPFVEGRTLREFLAENGPVIGQLARRIGRDAALGCAAVHRAGFVHRDVKPENLMITPDGEVRLMDLGLAHSARPDRDAKAWAFDGSLAYAAPELLRGGIATPASDIYALGVVLFEVVTGRHPFAESIADGSILEAHLHREPPRLSHIEPRVSDFMDFTLAAMLAKDPRERPANADELAETLRLGTASPQWRAVERNVPRYTSRRRLARMRRARHTAFFGRAREQRMLDALLNEARIGTGAAVFVNGPTGSGRRRLLDECIERWLDEDERLRFYGGIVPNEVSARRGAPFGDIIVDAFLQGDDVESPRASHRLIARIRASCRWSLEEARQLAAIATGKDAGLSSAERADLLFRALRHLIESEALTVMRIDHVEHLGTAGRMVLDQLLDRRHSLPLLLLLVSERNWHPGTFPGQEINLTGLTPIEFRQFGRALFDEAQAPDHLLDEAHAPLSGLPGALVESLEELRSTGHLVGRPGQLRELSASVAELRPGRLALDRLCDTVLALPAARRFVMQAAAVLGNSFRVDDLSKLTGRPELEVLEALWAFEGRFTAIDGDLGTFRHRDYRLATLTTLSPPERQRIHRTAAWVLEDRDAAPIEIGMHLSRAMEHEACLEPLLGALADLVANESRQDAPRLVERLNLHLNRLPRSQANNQKRLEWLLLGGQTWSLLGREKRATRAFRKANLIAAHLRDQVAKARALVGLADLAQARGRYLSAMSLLREAETVLSSASGRDADRASARAALVHGRVMAYQGRSLDAVRLTSEGLRRAPPADYELRTHLLVDLARWQTWRLRFGRAVLALDEAENLARSGASARARIDMHRGRTLGMLGLRERAEALFESAYEFARRHADQRMRARARLFLAELDVFVGDHRRARPLLLEAQRSANVAGDRVVSSMATAFLALGDDRDPEPHDVEVAGVPVLDLTWQLSEAARLLRAGAEEAAQELLDAALDIERSHRVHMYLRLSLLRAAGRHEAAERIIRVVAERLPLGFDRRTFTAHAESVRM